MVEGVKEASDAKDEISPPIGDPEETALKTAGDRAEDSAEQIALILGLVYDSSTESGSRQVTMADIAESSSLIDFFLTRLFFIQKQ